MIQGNINRISQVENIKEEIKKEISTQIKEGMQAIKNEIKTEIKAEIKKEFSDQIKRNSQATKNEVNNVLNRYAHDAEYRHLQSQASNSRHNLVLLGIPEHDHDSAYTQAAAFSLGSYVMGSSILSDRCLIILSGCNVYFS